ncbi:SDR family oxidoreductase [Mesobacillus foraminis]|uniref:SDR family oxidoreductase n=1 Tax=Mesobacillus foraminis TaxID=279826 RepID=UPI001BEAAFD8|nr:SDR family oxidoreductase [Mesobacillus foraminis]MBT2755578.1 SDR family oxidoreductase [Mesobacillus foraminis]
MEHKKVVVITGATRGIGRNMALFFAEKGYTVIGTGRDSEKLKEVKMELENISAGHSMLLMDVTNPAEIKQTVRTVMQEYSRIDVWINNAGAFKAIGPTWEVKEEDWVNDVTTNLFGTFYSVQAVVPAMLEQGFGRIINLVGGGTIGAFKYGNGYGTSKTSIARFTENLCEELEDTSIKVFALDPGLNDTDMTRYQRDTQDGKRYLSGIEDLFKQNIDVPPHQAPQHAYFMAEGKLDDYAGRVVTVYDDLEMLQNKAENTSDHEFFKLRLKN